MFHIQFCGWGCKGEAYHFCYAHVYFVKPLLCHQHVYDMGMLCLPFLLLFNFKEQLQRHLFVF